ncbi:unnamed protein product, partial [Onchocerca flexuosa]|uniref:threonine--tRNA ligase n=1 Tax=Onchocerca flexuosa TaxID=387005 RepID=A0A183I074_9BILA
MKGSANEAGAVSVMKTTRTPIELSSWPDFIEERIALFDKLMAKYHEEIAAKKPEKIKITLPNGKELEGKSWLTTPLMIAEQISQGLADSAVVAKVNGEVWDLDRPLECDATLQILKFDDDEGKQVFWHSSAHIMGEAMERYCGGHLCYGPPISEGFYYDMWKEDKQPFERLVVSKEDLLQMFKYNKFKVRIIEEKITTPFTTVYRCGPLIDLCRGPHVRHTGKVK